MTTGTHPPHNPLFDEAPRGLTAEEVQQIEQLRAKLPALVAERRERPRAERFYPYLLVRAAPGDMGARPIAAPHTGWQSPDIWIVPGLPATTPAIPGTMVHFQRGAA